MASPPNSSDAIIFGAGNIGRGLVAQLVSAAGMRPVMVEADVQLARRLREAGSYDVILTGRTEETHRITGYEVLTTDQRDRIDGAVAGAQFAATAVGGAHLEEVARTLAPALEKRATPLSILVCENRPGAEKILADSLVASGYKDAGSSCVKCSVERIVHGVEGSLALLGEGEQTLCADRKTWAGPIIE